MNSRIQCFWLEPSDVAVKVLRRYEAADWGSCPARYGYHNTRVTLGQVPYSLENGLQGYYSNFVDKSDPQWPTHCSCGYEFKDQDEWQSGMIRLHRRVDTGELLELATAPVGAMWDSNWFRGEVEYNQSHSEILTVRTPGGDWVVDGPSSSGSGWTRTGQVPHVTANPSIICGSYHGWLRGGWLEEC